MSKLSPERWQAVSPYLEQALALADEERAAWLATLREQSPGIAADLQTLLEEQRTLVREGFLEHAPLAVPSPPSLEGRTIGAYTIRRLIATGGMGTVYEAWQKQPQRPVALKLMKSGIASTSALRRFEYEAQLLARLRHPGIAQVYEAGTHDDGMGPVPFFAMEYIPQASSITEYASANQLTIPQRLELFGKVCEAVHHGHQKGIIHRDLKPSNILVDGTGQPKVIDFGVARATDSDIALTTLLTSVGQLIGTLQYMSPEQCAADPQDLDTRSDVYALGIVLYELLCGQLPYDVSREAIHEVARMIREQPPARPSTINKTLRGDLETIALKALEKDRERRYQSADDLARDLKRYLDHDPISARPPSAVYRTRMFVRRHRFGATVAVLGFVGLAAFGVAMAVQAERIARERDRANAEAVKAQKVSGFLEDLFLSIDPTRARGKEVTVREVLDGGHLKIQKELGAEPAVEVSLLRTLGNVYRNLGAYAPAHELVEEAVRTSRAVNGPNARPTLESERALAWLLFREGKLEEARAMQEELLGRTRTALGNDDPETLSQMNDLGVIDFNLGRNKEAEAILEECLQRLRRVLGSDNLQTLSTMNNLARAYRNLFRFQEAEALGRAALEAQKRILGPDHTETLHSMDNLAGILNATDRFSESEALHRETYAIRRRVLGDDHDHTLGSLEGVADAVVNQGRYAEAEALDRKLLELRRKTRGPDDPSVLGALENLALAEDGQGRQEEARALMSDVFQRSRRVVGPEHWNTLRRQGNLASLTAHVGRFDEAESLARDMLQISRRALGDKNPATGFALYDLASFSAMRGRKKQALDYLRQAVAAGESLTGILRDKDFNVLHGDPEFERLIAQAKTNTEGKP